MDVAKNWIAALSPWKTRPNIGVVRGLITYSSCFSVFNNQAVTIIMSVTACLAPSHCLFVSINFIHWVYTRSSYSKFGGSHFFQGGVIRD